MTFTKEKELPPLTNKKDEFSEGSLNSSIGRNDRCFCGSGLKYKKCCMKKNQPRIELMFENFKIKTDPLTPEESKKNFPILDEEDQELLSDIHNNFESIIKDVRSKEDDFFQKLESLRVKYPENPTILTFIGKGYESLGLEEELVKHLHQSYEQFPDYLFAQLPMVNWYLENENLEKAKEILKGAATLKQFKPDRDTFHISEFLTFENTIINYFLKIENFKLANDHLEILREFLEEEDPLFIHTSKKVAFTELIYRIENDECF